MRKKRIKNIFNEKKEKIYYQVHEYEVQQVLRKRSALAMVF